MLNQDYDNWEWVLLVNNGNIDVSRYENDDRVIILEAHKGVVNIGALKKICCDNATGDYLVELDHDDILSPQALSLMTKPVSDGADFIYSCCAEFEENGEYKTYSEQYGWLNSNITLEWVKEYGLNENVKFNIPHNINPSTLSSILYAPNHVRVWKKSFYDEIGGHDESMLVCDDYDLVCRSYLAGGKFEFINTPIYLYRLRGDGNNTFIKHNDLIQNMQSDTSDKYFHDICEEWARRHDLPMLDMGGSHHAKKGWTVVDINDLTISVEDYIKHDVTKSKLPFPDSSVGLIRAQDFLEHIPRCKDSSCTHGGTEEEPITCIVGLMNEFYRVLVPNGILITSTPSSDGRGAFQDPTHINFINTNSFWYYTDIEKAKYIRNDVDTKPNGCRFGIVKQSNVYPSEFHKLHNIVYCNVDMVALKGQYQASRQFI